VVQDLEDLPELRRLAAEEHLPLLGARPAACLHVPQAPVEA
jgi:hypothetical protein